MLNHQLKYLHICSYIQVWANGGSDQMREETTLDEQTATRVAELFSALSDTSRVRIISVLVGREMNVGTLAKALDLSESAVSHQLRGLRQMRLVRARKEGRHVFYMLDDEHVADLFQRGLDHVLHR